MSQFRSCLYFLFTVIDLNYGFKAEVSLVLKHCTIKAYAGV